MNHTREEWAALAERAAEELMGSCRSLTDLGEEFEGADNIRAFTDRLDELVFCCEGCCWWCEIGELRNDGTDGEWLCEDCTDDGS